MRDENIDKLFRQAFEDREEAPHANTWDAIQAGLSPKVIPIYRRSWFKATSTAAAVILIFGIAYFYSTTPTDGSISVVTNASDPTKDTSYQETLTLENNVNIELEKPTHLKTIEYGTQPNRLPLASTELEKDIPNSDKTALLAKSNSPIPIKLANLRLAKITLDSPLTSTPRTLKTHKVVEIDPIQPLIENIEQEDILLANSAAEEKRLLPTILNKISDVINPSDNKIIQFSQDEEGSLQLDITNSYVKSRFKKRK